MTGSLPAGLQPFFGEFGFLNPMLAAGAGAVAVSSVSVMLNSLRLRDLQPSTQRPT